MTIWLYQYEVRVRTFYLKYVDSEHRLIVHDCCCTHLILLANDLFLRNRKYNFYRDLLTLLYAASPLMDPKRRYWWNHVVTTAREGHTEINETDMLSFWRKFRHWLHRKLSKWHFRFLEGITVSDKTLHLSDVIAWKRFHTESLIGRETWDETRLTF